MTHAADVDSWTRVNRTNYIHIAIIYDKNNFQLQPTAVNCTGQQSSTVGSSWQLPTCANCYQQLATAANCYQVLPTAANYCQMLPTAANSCHLLPMAAQCNWQQLAAVLQQLAAVGNNCQQWHCLLLPTADNCCQLHLEAVASIWQPLTAVSTLFLFPIKTLHNFKICVTFVLSH